MVKDLHIPVTPSFDMEIKFTRKESSIKKPGNPIDILIDSKGLFYNFTLGGHSECGQV